MALPEQPDQVRVLLFLDVLPVGVLLVDNEDLVNSG
jgi:hypothetical protein